MKMEQNFELVFIPCEENHPQAVGGYQSYDGQSMCHVREGYVPVSQPPAEKADDILDDVHQRIIDGQLKGMSLEKAIYTVGYEDGRKEKGAVWVKAINGLPADRKRNYIFRQANNTRSAQVVYLDHVNDISTYLKLPLEDIEYLDESPTAAGDGKEAIAFAEWIGVQGYSHLGNGVWAQEGVVNSLTTTAQLYDIFKQQNK